MYVNMYAAFSRSFFSTSPISRLIRRESSMRMPLAMFTFGMRKHAQNRACATPRSASRTSRTQSPSVVISGRRRFTVQRMVEAMTCFESASHACARRSVRRMLTTLSTSNVERSSGSNRLIQSSRSAGRKDRVHRRMSARGRVDGVFHGGDRCSSR